MSAFFYIYFLLLFFSLFLPPFLSPFLPSTLSLSLSLSLSPSLPPSPRNVSNSRPLCKATTSTYWKCPPTQPWRSQTVGRRERSSMGFLTGSTKVTYVHIRMTTKQIETDTTGRNNMYFLEIIIIDWQFLILEAN